MAAFNQNTIYQVSGFSNPCISGELVWNQATYWNLAFTNQAGGAVDLTGATINAQIIRREVSNLQDTRTGLSFNIADYTPTPTAITLNIVNLNASAGTFTLVIDDSTWSLVSTDPELEINAQNPVCFSGRIMVNFPAISGGNPADDAVIFLLFLVRSDGIVVV